MFDLSNEVVYETSRSSGPGGQYVQKTSSRVTIRWNINSSIFFTQEEKNLLKNKLDNRINKSQEIVIHVESHRSQHRNKKVALSLLTALIIKALIVPKKRKATKPSKRSITKRLDSKKQTGDKKRLRKKPDWS